jgi:hypothetical protein
MGAVVWLAWMIDRDLHEMDGLSAVDLSNVRALTDSELDDWPDYFTTRTTQSSHKPTERMH